MPIITLPDGNDINFSKKVTGLEVAEKISKSLSKQASIISVDGELKDLNHIIDKDCSVKIFTSKDKEGLDTIRHDTAHITAMAVQEIFPGTQVTIGPVIENGFYYDFSRKEPFTEEDLSKIENKMKEIVDRDVLTTREVWNRDKAINLALKFLPRLMEKLSQ
jgi:threonyl-tRNA synthetase